MVRITDDAELQLVKQGFASYVEALRPELRLLLNRFSLVDFARKVVGVGSVGMPTYVGLYMSADNDPLFLQVKLAVESVLKPFVAVDEQFAHPRRAGGDRPTTHAGRQRPAARLGDGPRRRALLRPATRDMKLSFDVTKMKPSQVAQYADACAQVLARSHSRTGDPALIAGYLGGTDKSDPFDSAIADFAMTYADQTERDFSALKQAIKDHSVKAQRGI